MSYPEFSEQIFFFCRDPIYRVRDLSEHVSCKIHHMACEPLINHGRDNEFSLAKPVMPFVRTIIHRVPIDPDSSKKCLPTLQGKIHNRVPTKVLNSWSSH